MKIAIFSPFLLFMISSLWAEDLDKEKTYSEKLKEAYAEKLKKSKELYDKGMKVASEKYGVTGHLAADSFGEEAARSLGFGS